MEHEKNSAHTHKKRQAAIVIILRVQNAQAKAYIIIKRYCAVSTPMEIQIAVLRARNNGETCAQAIVSFEYISYGSVCLCLCTTVYLCAADLM